MTYTPDQINAGIATNALGNFQQPWRLPLLTTNDSYRIAAYTDGANLYLASCKGGNGTWVATSVMVAPSLGTLNSMCLYTATNSSTRQGVAFVGGDSTSATLYLIPYNGAGSFGSVITLGLGSGYTAAPLSTMVVCDPNGTTIDANHISGASGLLHVIVDFGASWDLYCVDLNSSGGFKVTISQSTSLSLTNPTGNTNLALLGGNSLYGITPGSAAWAALPITYQSFTTTTTTTTGNPLDIYLGNQGGVAGSITYNFPVNQGTMEGGYWYFYLNPPGDISASSVTINGQAATASPTTIDCWYVSLPAGSYGTVPVYINMNASPSTTINPELSTPGYTTTSTTTTNTNDYSVGAQEAPSIALSPYGAALAPSDTTSTPGVDILVNNAGVLNLQNRSSGGTYASPQNIGGTGAVGSPAIALNTQNGDAIALAMSSFGGAAHIGSINRTNGAWGQWLQEDSSGTALQSEWTALANTLLSLVGPAVCYQDGTTTPYPLMYDDAGSAAGAVAPGPPDHLAMVNTTSTSNDITGSGSSYTATTERPTFRFYYESTSPNDAMGGYRLIFANASGGATAWDTGQVGVSNGPLPGNPYTVPYGGSALTPGDTYNVNCYAYESLAGLEGPVSATITVYIAPAIPALAIDTSTISTASWNYAFDYYQSQGIAGASYSLVIDDGTGALVFQTGTQMPASAIKCADLVATNPPGAGPTITPIGTTGTTDYWYAVAFETINGPTPIGPAVETTTGNATLSTTNYNALSALPIGPSTVTGRLIYRSTTSATAGFALVDTLSDNTTTTWNDTGAAAGAAPAATNSTGNTPVGATKLPVDHPLDVNTTLAIDTGSNLETATVSSISGSAAPYVVTLAAGTTIAHSAGAQVATRFTTPSLDGSKMPNNEALQGKLTVTVQPPSGVSAWSGTATATITTAFPEPPTPTDFFAEAISGMLPTDAAYVSLRWNQPAATSPAPAAATTNIYQRESGTSVWTLIGNLPAATGLNTARIYSAVSGQSYDYAITPASSRNILGSQVAATGVTLNLRLGFHLLDPDDPTSCLELGLSPQSGSMPIWDPIVQQDYGMMYGRVAPVVTTGTAFSYAHDSDMTYIFEPGYRQVCQQQLQSWMQAGKTLLFREAINGLMFFATLKKAAPTSVQHSSIPGIVVNVSQSDQGSYTYIVTQ